MRPKQRETSKSDDLFRARLDQIINPEHELLRLAAKIDWTWIDGEIAPLYSEHGRPAVPTRFMIGLLLLKHIYALSDEDVCERWVENPYFQFFTGEEFFQHTFPHERSGLSHWRKRLGDKLGLLLAESLRVAHTSGALRPRDLVRVTVDTTVQPKNITFPTDAKLVHAAIKGLNRLARQHGVPLRQSYLRLAKRAAMMAGRYAHAKQFNRPSANCASCALGWAGWSAISAARSEAGTISKRPSRNPSHELPRSAPSSSASAAGSSIPSMPRRSSALAKARPARPMNLASRSRSWPPTAAPRPASSCCTPSPCPAIHTTATR